MSTLLPPAGWYADPTSSVHQRWWDGARWTEFLQPSPPLPVERAGGVATAPGAAATAPVIAASSPNTAPADLAPPLVPGLTAPSATAAQSRQPAARSSRRRSLWRPSAR